jgi:hypothetical protein
LPHIDEAWRFHVEAVISFGVGLDQCTGQYFVTRALRDEFKSWLHGSLFQSLMPH